MADTTGAQAVGGGSRLLGFNQLQTSIDDLTAVMKQIATKLGGTAGPTGSNTTFTAAPMLNQVSPGGNAGSPTMGNAAPTQNATSSGGNGGWGSAIGTGLATSASSGLIASAQNFGSGQLGTQAALSAYLQQGSVFGGNIGGLRNNITTLNDIANSPSDLVQGMSLLNYASGAYGTQNPLRRGMTGAANMVGFLNPTLGLTGSASLAQQIYSQQTSMNMLALGYGMTPRTMGGGTNSIQAINQAILQRTFGSGKVNQGAFNASAAIGGRLNYNLQALGFQGQDLTNLESMLSAQNLLSNKGYTNNQIQGIFTGASRGNQTSLNQLQGAGINASSVLQVLKNKGALSTQQAGETEQGFEAGLRQSVGLLNKFNEGLNNLLRGPLGRFVGYAGGLGASGLSGLLEKIPVVGGLLGGVSSILGGGAASTVPAGSARSSPGKQSSIPSGASGAAMAAVGWAKQELGVPYLWGGEQPGVGFDCSGLTQWSYKQAGISIPRTSQQQWAALSRNHSVGLNQVQAGDLIFSAGSGDGGTFDAPGHVAMMVSNNTLIQAATTGTDIMLTPYDPRQWDHAARPTGPGTAGTGPPGSSSSTSGPASGAGSNRGFGGFSEAGSMGSTEEIDAIAAALGGSGSFMSGFRTGTPGSGTRTKPGGGAPNAPGNISKNAALAKAMAAKRGWTGVQWNDLYALWTRESGFDERATNPTSGAYGIPQSLPGNKMASAGADWRTNPVTQEKWGMGYIGGRYKDPAGAWAHEQQFGWYARGTSNANPGVAIVGEDGAEAILTGRGGQSIMTAGQTAGMLAQIQSGQGRGRFAMGGGGVMLTLNLQPGAITISSMGAGAGDISSSMREVASQLGKYLADEDVIKKIATGVSS